MKVIYKAAIAASLLAFVMTLHGGSEVSATPRVFLLDGRHLQAVKERIASGDKTLAPAVSKLQRDAKKALRAGPFSVVDRVVAPSGDVHDYVSQAPYFWRNPKTSNGLPYVRRDGERNPEIKNLPDHDNLHEMAEAVETLALAYYFQGEEFYAAKAAELLRTWFLAEGTRMNPHLQYAQAIPGVNTGRGIGLIETRCLVEVVDSIGLLAGSKAWTAADQNGMTEWLDNFLQWMLTSDNGRDEAAQRNNHGTYYDLQVASLALFVGKTDLAADVVKNVAQKRIAQIEPDGRQPLELARTKAWSYSIGNLSGLLSLARLGEHAGVDLWNHETADGRSIRKALDYLTPFAVGEQKWPYQQLGGFSRSGAFGLLRRGGSKYSDEQYKSVLRKLPRLEPEHRSNLLVASAEDSTVQRPVKVLVITGGHGFEQKPFFDVFKSNPEISFSHAAHAKTNATGWERGDIQNQDVIVLYDMPRTITHGQKARFLSIFDKGIGLVVLHHALVSYQDWPEYERIIGGRYPENPAKAGVVTTEVGYEHDVDVPVKIVAKDHPITSGLSDFVIHDEIYWGFRVGKDARPLLTTTHPKSGKPLAWTRSEGKSRIVYIQLGHGPSAYENPNYRKLIAQSIRWAAHKSTP